MSLVPRTSRDGSKRCVHPQGSEEKRTFCEELRKRIVEYTGTEMRGVPWSYLDI
jgi:hypothetical protein